MHTDEHIPTKNYRYGLQNYRNSVNLQRIYIPDIRTSVTPNSGHGSMTADRFTHTESSEADRCYRLIEARVCESGLHLLHHNQRAN